MILLAALCVTGFAAGFLLLWRVPMCNGAPGIIDRPTSFIIPARNEAHNLPALLQSLGNISASRHEVLVVDDASTDGTGDLARSFCANVIVPPPLPAGWTGKNWACHQGALASGNEFLFFLDADTRFAKEGYLRLLRSLDGMDDKRIVVSILPYHQTEEWYEELSLFFHILVAMGAGGFGPVDRPHLFGQSLLINRDAYEACGGHDSVRSYILENFAMSERLNQAGYRCRTIAGRGVLWTRMFPEGFEQLRESWTKAFASGAVQCSPQVLALSILWLSAGLDAFLGLMGTHHWLFALLYVCFVLQIAHFGRKLGSYRFLTSVLYPVGLVFYFTLFSISLTRRIRRQRPTWRGREV
ncbi:glycosyltransferase [Silvibacterium acidisoli]|uniref:glycosyltransferase n=1 Tax=Acidobacteriaceae bacterium ZG23-2 TaxID=2883246 RepID=UPI00406C4F19